MKKNIVVTFMIMFLSLLFNGNIISASESIQTFDGDLGYIYSNSSTEFRVWSSSASEVSIVIDGIGVKGMTKDASTNVWLVGVSGDLSGYEYSYNIKYEDGTTYEGVLDPYGKYLNNEGTKNVVYNSNVSSFQGWYDINSSIVVKDRNKIIYGIDIDSFSSSLSWDGITANRGKLLALNESGTSYHNTLTGFDHVKNLGITYIELSDIIDSVNPFVVNKKYVSGSNAYSGAYELKQVINSYYNSSMGVILAFDIESLSNKLSNDILNKIDKEYYSINQLNMNKYMVERYIEEVILYWVKEYKLAGIKFENMAKYDVEFINNISSKLKEINENILIYGDGSYESLDENKAGENNLENLDDVKMINGSLNYSLIGDVNSRDTKGILGGNYNENVIESLKFAFLSSVDNGEINYSLVNGISYKNYWGNKNSYQIVNYLGTRDGLSVYDKLIINNLTGNKIIAQKIVLAFGTLMISGGIPYIEAGNEFLVSYRNFDNNFDSICTENDAFCFYSNSDKKIIDWSYAYKNSTTTDAFKSLVNFRKGDKLYVQTEAEIIKNVVKIHIGEPGNIGYVRNYPNAYVNDTEKVVVLFNYSNDEYSINNYGGDGWKGSYQYNLSSRSSGVVSMRANSIYMEYKSKPPKISQWLLLVIILGVIGSIYSLNIFLNKKLVESRGYDINDINKKYRPFINKNNIKNNNANETNADETINEDDVENKK